MIMTKRTNPQSVPVGKFDNVNKGYIRNVNCIVKGALWMINVGVCAREREKVIILACGTFSLKGIRAIHSVHGNILSQYLNSHNNRNNSINDLRYDQVFTNFINCDFIIASLCIKWNRLEDFYKMFESNSDPN